VINSKNLGAGQGMLRFDRELQPAPIEQSAAQHGGLHAEVGSSLIEDGAVRWARSRPPEP